jgi:hypothetical protein
MPDHVAKRIIPHHLMEAAMELGVVAGPKAPLDPNRVYCDCDFSSLELRIWAEMNSGLDRDTDFSDLRIWEEMNRGLDR